MRVSGINLAAVLVAALATYVVGAIIYGFLVSPETWMVYSGISKEEMDAVGTSRMPYSPFIPLVSCAALAVLFKWANVSGAANGAKWAALVAIASALPALWYGWVYGVGAIAEPLLDSAHLLLGHVVAGTILAAWK